MTETSSGYGIIFDVDGVLIDSAEAHFESWRRLGQEHGVAITRAQFVPTFGRHNRDIIPMLFDQHNTESVAALSDRKEAIYRDIVHDNLPIVAGGAELIANARAAGFRLAVGSSAPRANIDLVLEAMDVGGRFDAVISAEDVQRGKPDPQVFLLAATRLGLEPQRCAVIEDAPAGIQAAKAAGAVAVGIAIYHSKDRLAEADLVVGALRELEIGAVRSLFT